MPRLKSRLLNSSVGLAVTLLFVWLFLRNIELQKVVSSFSRISIPTIFLSLVFLISAYVVRIARWWWTLRMLNRRVRLLACVWPFLISVALNNLIPFRAGDAARVIAFREQLGVPAMRLLGTLFVERLLDATVLLSFFYLGLYWLAPDTVPDAVLHVSAILAVLALSIIAFIVFFHRRVESFLYWIGCQPYFAQNKWGQILKRQAKNIFIAVSVLRAPSRLVQLLFLTGVSWCFEGAVFAALAVSFDCENICGGAWFAMATGTLATLLPSSPGYIGTFDYFTMLGFTAYGMERNVAATLALAVHAMLWVPPTAAGVLYFLFGTGFHQSFGSSGKTGAV